MSDIRIPAGETDVTRDFHIDLPPETVGRFALVMVISDRSV